MRILTLILMSLWLSTLNAAQEHGEYLGAKQADKPEWFKESFLEFEGDVAEAAAEGRRVMLYFYQDGCPYCARLVEENFADPEIEGFVREHFDGISLNMWGDREVVTVAGKGFTEKTLAEALKVQFTPTLLFLDEAGKVVLRLNGYYPPHKFSQALRYVAQKKEHEIAFTDFLRETEEASGRGLIAEDFFTQTSDLQALVNSSDKPLALYFQARECADCARLHEQVLSDAPTRAIVESMNNVLLDLDSEQPVTTPNGKLMSQREYADLLNVRYIPAIVLLDPQGEEVHRVEGFFKTFHVQSSLAYVLGGGYLKQPNFQRYIAARGEKIREQGYAVDIYGYRSFHPADMKMLD